MQTPEVNKAARLEQVHPQDVVAGNSDIGSIRMSVELHDELSDPVKKKYRRLTKSNAKNIGELELYS